MEGGDASDEEESISVKGVDTDIRDTKYIDPTRSEKKVEAVVEYDYDAVNPDELSLKEGEIINNINMLEEGWWEGELNGKRGMFPDNFVKVIKEDKPDNKSSAKSSKAPAPPVNGDSASIHSSQSGGSGGSEDPQVVKKDNSSAKRKFRAKVAFSYHPENEDELNLEVDDIVDVVGQPEDGWWEGVVRGYKGVFPSNFVTLLEEDDNSMDVTNGKADKTDGLSPPGESETKEPQQPPVKLIRPMSIFKGTEDHQSSEPKGEDLPPKEEEAPVPKPAKGLGKPVGGVGFGNIFAGGNQDSSKPKKAEPPKRPELSVMAQKRQSFRKLLEDPAKKEKKKVKEIKPEKKEEKKEEMSEEIETVVEKAKVQFDYDAQNPDELSLKEGDIVVITSKEAGDSGWWEGEVGGRKGVFPDNFVTLLPPERTRKKVPTRPNADPGTVHIPIEILARGLVSLTAYKKALQSGKKAVYRTRLMFVGQERVGKTSLKKRLTGKRFDPQESITDGIDTSNSCHVSVEQVRNWNVDLSQGDVHVHALAECMAKDLRTVDTTVETPQPTLPNKRMREVTHSAAKTEMVTNQSVRKETAREETMPPEVQKALLEELQKDTAADVNGDLELSLWDFAGQELYYVTHQVFLSKRSVVLMVFNLAETIAQQQEIQWLRDLDFWMHSIYAFTTEGHEQCQSTQDQLSPPIILVGTHRNQLDSSEDERDQLIKKTFETIEESLQGKCYRRHVVNDKFAIENGEDTGEDNTNGIVELQAKIASVAKKESYMGEEIPLRWLKFEESVKSAVKDGVDCMPIHEIKNMDGAREIPSTEPAELSAMLHFYHDLGIIMYHPNATSSLRELIILDPQWLISVFKSIITVLDKDKRRPLDKEAWERLENEGVLEDRLINHMWRNFHVNGKQMKEELLDLMEKYDLLVKQRQPTNADACPSCYYVPSRLQIESGGTPDERPGCTVFYVDFVSFLPAGIFYRLMARAVEWSQQQGDAEQPPVLSRTKSSFVADDYHQFELCRTGNMIMVTIVPDELVGERSRDNADPRTTTQVKSFLESALSNLKTTWAPRIQYRFVFKCPCAKGDEHYLDLNKCLDVTSANIQCCKKKRIAKKVIREKFCHGVNTQKPTEREHPEDQYEMCHTPRGLCCIINNMDFHIARQNGVNLSDRNGSEKDAGALETTFSSLQFAVEVKNNLTAPDMLRYLQSQANKHDDICVDCFVCCILTHGGGQGKLYGVNGEALDILDATSLFKGLQCPGLRGKPKLFFIQACRGSDQQLGACYVETDDVSSDVLLRDCTLPNEADFLLGYATVSGFVSYRSTIQGSWYIQTLTAMINQHNSSSDLLHILTLVNYEVSKKEAGREKSKQILMNI